MPLTETERTQVVFVFREVARAMAGWHPEECELFAQRVSSLATQTKREMEREATIQKLAGNKRKPPQNAQEARAMLREIAELRDTVQRLGFLAIHAEGNKEGTEATKARYAQDEAKRKLQELRELVAKYGNSLPA